MIYLLIKDPDLIAFLHQKGFSSFRQGDREAFCEQDVAELISLSAFSKEDMIRTGRLCF